MEAWKIAESIIKILNENGHAAYFVGGCVRDRLMGLEPDDIDITTAAIPTEIKELFGKTVDTGVKHGTVTVLKDGFSFEITTFRTEDGYADHRKPDGVHFVRNIREDLRRRDFTINAVAYHPQEGIVDPYGGREDIQNKIIRCVGNPDERFEEDALRMLRCVRFACKTGFEVESETLAAICRKKALISYVSAERIYAELKKSVTGAYPMALALAQETGLFSIFLPELSECFKTPQHTKYHIYDVGNHILHTVAAAKNNETVRLAALLHDIGKPLCRTTDEKGTDHFYGHEAKSAVLADGVLKRLKADNAMKNRVTAIIKEHRLEQEPTDFYVKQKILAVGKDNFSYLLDLMDADTAAHNQKETKERQRQMRVFREKYNEIINRGDPLCVADLALKGGDIMRAGFKDAEIGKVQKKLLNFVLERPEANTREILLERITK